MSFALNCQWSFLKFPACGENCLIEGIEIDTRPSSHLHFQLFANLALEQTPCK